MISYDQFKTQADAFLKNDYTIYRAPGRINLIGEHTDYNGGLVLPAAIDQYLFIAIQKGLKQGEHFYYSLNYQEALVIQSFDQKIDGWGKYIQSVLYVLSEKGFSIPSTKCIIGSHIPLGAGLSSSAALTSGLLFAINEEFSLNLSRLEIAILAQQAEHFAGTKCGIMDLFAVLFSKKDHVLLLNCTTLDYEAISLKIGDYRLVLFDSQVHHQLATSEYNLRRETCEQALEMLQQHRKTISNISDLQLGDTEWIMAILPDNMYQKVSFVIEENDRVNETVAAIKAGDLRKVGAKMFASHEGLKTKYQVSCEELDFFVSFVKGIEGVLGARMMGGGFGGCSINLIHKNVIEMVFDKLNKAYMKKFNKTARKFVFQLEDGVRKL